MFALHRPVFCVKVQFWAASERCLMSETASWSPLAPLAREAAGSSHIGRHAGKRASCCSGFNHNLFFFFNLCDCKRSLSLQGLFFFLKDTICSIIYSTRGTGDRFHRNFSVFRASFSSVLLN